ncbi:MAG: nucleotidyltransferase [bacterium]
MSPDWEPTFASWAQPPGKTEQDKCDNAERAIRKAADSWADLASRSRVVFPQGSYRNRTNVRADSDVDVCIMCTESFFYHIPDGTTPADFDFTTPASYPYADFKGDVQAALVSYFGAGSVRRGKKAFDIHHNTYRVDADVLPAFEYRYYRKYGSYLKGAAFLPDGGSLTVNWPEQNYANGVQKNDATGRRFKAIVRILKRLGNKMADEGYASAGEAPSFLIECLLWNVPNEGFGHSTYTSDVRWALAHLFNNTSADSGCTEWREVNKMKYLFRTGQPWTRQQAHEFISAAWDYVGFE